MKPAKVQHVGKVRLRVDVQRHGESEMFGWSVWQVSGIGVDQWLAGGIGETRFLAWAQVADFFRREHERTADLRGR